MGLFLGNYLLPVSLSAEKGNKPKLHHRCPDDDKGQQQQTRVPPSNMCCQTGCSSSLFLAHALRCCSTPTFFVERSFSVQFLEEVFQECLNFWVKFWPGFAAPEGENFFFGKRRFPKRRFPKRRAPAVLWRVGRTPSHPPQNRQFPFFAERSFSVQFAGVFQF